MNKKQSLLILLASLVVVAAVIASGGIIRAQSSATNVSVTKWDYLLIYGSAPEIRRDIDDLAGQGFEILDFKVTQFEPVYRPVYHIVFKRRRP